MASFVVDSVERSAIACAPRLRSVVVESRWRRVAAVALWAAGLACAPETAQAQQELAATTHEIGETPTQEPRWGVLTPSLGTEVQEFQLARLPPRRHRAGGRTLEILGGTIGAGIGIGVTVSMLLSNFWDKPASSFYAEAISGSALGLTLLNVGVYAAGYETGGRGSFGTTFLGSLVGLGAGALTVLAMWALNVSEAIFFTGIALIPGLAIAGAVVGYELSDARARGRSGQELVPVLSMLRGGASVGLAGTW